MKNLKRAEEFLKIYTIDTIRSSDHTRLREAFWNKFSEVLQICLVWKSEIYIGLSWGSSLDIVYMEILVGFWSFPVDIRHKIRWCLLDERVVSVDHPDSNMRQLREKFLSWLLTLWSIDECQIIWLSHDLSSRMQWSEMKRNVAIQVPDSGLLRPSQWQNWDITSEYSTRVPRIDIGLFGVGPDGHIASLFPRHPLLGSQESCYLEITDSPKPPAHRITVSPQMIRDMKYAFIAFMQGKEEAYSHFLDEDISLEDCPAKMVKEVKNLVVMSDIEWLTDEK